MPLATIIAGPYTGAWNGDALGNTEDGFQLSYNFEKLPVTVDFYGDSVIDNVYRGVNGRISVVAMEYGLVLASTSFPYGAAAGGVGIVGRMDVGSSISKALVLTSTAGTTAAAAPATLTATNSILSQESVNMLFAARTRTINMTFDLMIYDSTGTIVLFEIT